jgi:bacterioferritin (cytochrome b1)
MTRTVSRPKPSEALPTGGDPREREIGKESMDPIRLIADLNRMLADEQGCAIRYATHAALVAGPFVDPVARRLQEIAGDELRHAGRLRERICALGGLPTMEAHISRPTHFLSLNEILEGNILEEVAAIESYMRILDTVPRGEIRLRRTIEDILIEEQEHLEELGALKAAGGAACPCMQGRAGRRLRDDAGARPSQDASSADFEE